MCLFALFVCVFVCSICLCVCLFNCLFVCVSDTIFILCHSLILLSVDLSSPHVKNKMSKREFIKNLRGVVQGSGSEFTGDLYDHVYLQGHIASHRAKSAAATACKARSKPFPFERPYGKIFLHV